jgi:hypothetical protein
MKKKNSRTCIGFTVMDIHVFPPPSVVPGWIGVPVKQWMLLGFIQLGM